MPATKIFSLKKVKRKYKILISCLHGIILFFGLWFINNTSWSTDVDETVLSELNILQSIILPDKHNYPADFVFINVSKDISLIDDPEEYGKIAITNRRQLSEFFKILADNDNRHFYALCDLFFEYGSDEDSTLEMEINRAKKVLFPHHLEDGELIKPIINIPSALANYETYNGAFSRFKLVYDSLKTIPVVLHEAIEKKPYHPSFFNFKSISPHYFIRPYHLFESKEYPYFNLGELLLLKETDSFFNNFLANKFIVIGNFDVDIHSTPIGEINGALILLNSYLSIRNGEASFGIGWMIFMFIMLSIISYILFFGRIEPPETKNIWMEIFLDSLINKYVSFFGLGFLTVFVSIFFFSIQLNVSSLIVYLLAVNFLFDFSKKYLNRNYRG